MKRTLIALAVIAAAYASAANAAQWCTKVGFQPGTPNPNVCYDTALKQPVPPMTKPASIPFKSLSEATSRPAAPTSASAQANPAATPAAPSVQPQVDTGVAQAAALILPHGPGLSLGVGAARYGSSSAVGLSGAYTSGSLTLSAGVARGSTGRTLTRVGAVWSF